jgi:hypothetical protein
VSEITEDYLDTFIPPEAALSKYAKGIEEKIIGRFSRLVIE